MERVQMVNETAEQGSGRREVYELVVEEWGREAQIMMAIEECSELIKELTKLYRGDTVSQNVAEEVADAEIMMEQCRVMFGETNVESYKTQKVERLRARLEQSHDTEESE